MSKPTVVLEIEKVLEASLVEARVRPGGDRIGSLKVLKRSTPRYAFDEAGKRLIGLNLADTNLTNEQWQALLQISGLASGDMQVLNLSDNQLTEFRLPDSMRNLEWLNIEDNPLTFPAEEMIKQGQEATLAFLKSLLVQGERDVYEVKMLIVGEGGTGKTTLWNKLQNPDHPVPDETQASTIGIGIKEGWNFPHPDHPGTDFLVNLWDFGGQEIQYMTHQFFLTRRSFYVLLADGRREVANFAYWFKIINLLGCEEKQEKPMPVLVVLNEKGNPIARMPYNPGTVKIDFPQLDVRKREVDFGKDDGRFPALEQGIKHLLSSELAHLPFKMPEYWAEVREALYELRPTTNHISWEQEFKPLCRKKKITEVQEMESLSQLLHDLGVILHFQEDLELSDFMVLKPDWAVQAIYEIFRHEEVKQAQGRFTKQLLREIWNHCGYTRQEQGQLMNLMLKDNLEVCFQADEAGQKLLIAPQLLPDVSPDFNWSPDASALRYTYQYPFMPKGLIGRLIVRLHPLLLSDAENRKVLWDKGMLLTHADTQARALVQETTDQTTGGTIIQIEITGPGPLERKQLLRDIRKELNHLHRHSFPALKYEEKIPCCCKQCTHSDQPEFYGLSQIRLAQEMAKATIECRRSFEDVLILALLEGVYEEVQQAPVRNPCQELVAKGNLKEAISWLANEVTAYEDQDEIILLERRLQDLRRLQQRNSISSADANLETGKISEAVLELCKKTISPK